MSATLVLPAVLRQDAGGRPEVELAEGTVRAALDALSATLPRLERRVRDEQGNLRPHVRLYLGDRDLDELAGLDSQLGEGARLYVIPAVSGG
ncbi:MAG: MoaD/ThiS family protein [Candidatus Dormiibacterota bacterium]